MSSVMAKSFTESVERIVRWDWIDQANYNSSATCPIWLVAFRDQQEIITRQGVAFRPTDRIETNPGAQPTTAEPVYRTFLDDVLAKMAKIAEPNKIADR